MSPHPGAASGAAASPGVPADPPLETPVALVLFNRPDLVKRVFEAIARARPRRLFLIADGPRPDHPDDVDRCAAARAVVERVDWECEVTRNYSDENLGCGLRPATGIDWVFEHVEEAIVLEDDCVPRHCFFRFCGELLEWYRDDERVVQICGNNYRVAPAAGEDSYYFSYHNICHGGWATWRRAWRHFDMGVRLWPSLRGGAWLDAIAGHPVATRFWASRFDLAFADPRGVTFWDYQWTFACWAQHGLSVLPRVTLVSNIGFGEDATHTKRPKGPVANLPTEDLAFPLHHPACMARAVEADRSLVERLVVLPRLSPRRDVRGAIRRVTRGGLRRLRRGLGRVPGLAG